METSDNEETSIAINKRRRGASASTTSDDADIPLTTRARSAGKRINISFDDDLSEDGVSVSTLDDDGYTSAGVTGHRGGMDVDDIEEGDDENDDEDDDPDFEEEEEEDYIPPADEEEEEDDDDDEDEVYHSHSHGTPKKNNKRRQLHGGHGHGDKAASASASPSATQQQKKKKMRNSSSGTTSPTNSSTGGRSSSRGDVSVGGGDTGGHGTTDSSDEAGKPPNAIQYHCDYCQKDLSNVVKIKCSVCEDFDLCLECFSVGAEIYPHKNHHDYQVIDNMHFPMFTEDWGADEELLLLEAIESFNMGNWNEISDNVGTKSPLDCRNHYFTYYLNSSTSPLPDTSKVLTTNENVHFKRAKPTFYNPNERKNKKNADTSEGPSGPVTDSVGFMKNRGHFEYEYDNDAEVVIKDLGFEQDDPPSDREIKLQVLDAYNQRLNERISRRNFIIEKGLLDYKRMERKRVKDDKEVFNSLKVFLQSMSKEDHEKLVNGVIAEKNLMTRIKQIQEYRANGIRTFEEANQFEEDKRKREQEKSVRKSKSELTSYHAEKPTVYKSRSELVKDREDTFLGIKNHQDRKPTKLKKNVDLEFEGIPNANALSIKEKQLCSSIRILPRQYLLIKETILAESTKLSKQQPPPTKQPLIKLSNISKLIELDQSKISKILEFFEQCRWINQ
ncbi:myb domain-containing protein [Cavenderia fasciculata]|uniref:Myb domain-containing protein n=1 Tax=Cavenderia fasciculata TaxID=261658 RepID=F4QFP1_CACFS|nr:myb domain-containing protein [Cavenderia fasciculata]EGG13494.1 myb domain-containing protein [Cavenderia fasciculata]|eukprot:XP_004350198.1 myb domain-containing protein [Cavenderia fasciculata]